MFASIGVSLDGFEQPFAKAYKFEPTAYVEGVCFICVCKLALVYFTLCYVGEYDYPFTGEKYDMEEKSLQGSNLASAVVRFNLMHGFIWL